MSAHETERLWPYAAQELDAATTALVREHLRDCPECRDALEQVRWQRRALEDLSHQRPKVDWSRVQLRRAAARRRLGLGVGASPRLGWALAAAAMAATLVAFGAWVGRQTARAPAVPWVTSAPPS